MADLTLEDWVEKCFPSPLYWGEQPDPGYRVADVEVATHVEGSSGFGMETLLECQECWALVRDYKMHAEWHNTVYHNGPRG